MGEKSACTVILIVHDGVQVVGGLRKQREDQIEIMQKRALTDMRILNCTSGSNNETDGVVSEMKDLRSFTGVSSAYRVMAVSPDAKKLLFKKTNKHLYLYDIDDENQSSDYTITGIDPEHIDDTIFDVAFLETETICLILQSRQGNLYITKATLNLALKLIAVCSAITFTQIICKKHYATSMIYDEIGPVLISYPLTSQNKARSDPPKIWLLHLLSFYSREGVRTVAVEVNIKDKKALFCDPFIYQNCVYLFNRFESTILSVSITGKNRGHTQILNTHPDVRFRKPNNKYANRCLLLLRNVILVYCHQRLDKPDEEPQLWLLKLKTMTWYRLHLILSHHHPTGSINFHKSIKEELAYLHGECGRLRCLERVHLYQLSTTQDSIIMSYESSDRPYRTSLIDQKRNKSSRRSVSAVEVNRRTSCGSSEIESKIVPEQIAPSLRYLRKYSRDKAKKNSHSSSSSSSSSSTTAGALADSSGQTQLLSATLSQSVSDLSSDNKYVHWSEEMAETNDLLTISEQLRLAKDMGYTDEEIMQAISMNCFTDGSYRAFSSTNAMIDILARVQRMYETAESIDSGSGMDKKHESVIQLRNEGDENLDRSNYLHGSLLYAPGSGVRRAASFYGASPTIRNSPGMLTSSLYKYRSCLPQFQLQRLLDAFEKERKSFSDESKRSIRSLEDRCRQFADNQEVLQVRLLEKDSEIELLKAQLSTVAENDEQLRSLKAKLDSELLESKSKSDQIRVLTQQAEIVEKQHENEIREKDKCISELFSKLKAAEDASKPALEKTANLQSEIDDLKQQLAKKEDDLKKCGNCYDEIRKAEQLIEQIRLERDEVRSTLSKIPTCVICLDKRPQILYMPCSHFICCEGCGSRFEQCPACRQKICGKITAYQ